MTKHLSENKMDLSSLVALKNERIKFDNTLINLLPQKIFYKDTNSVYLFCNENYAQGLGIKAYQIVGKTDFDFYSSDLAEKYRNDDKLIMEKGEVSQFEEDYAEEDSYFTVHTIKSPVKDDSGMVIGILGVFWIVDTVDAFVYEKNKLNLDFKQFYEKASDAYVRFDANGNILDFNKAFEKLTSKKRIEIQGENIKKFTPKKYWESDERILSEQVNGRGYSDAFDKEIKCKNKTLHVSVQLYKYSEQQGGYWGIFRDINERVKAELEIKRDRDIARNYLSITGGLFVILDLNQRVRLINKKGADLIGLPEKAIIGSNWFDLVLPVDQRSEAKQSYITSLNEDSIEHTNYEDEIITQHDEKRVFSWDHAILYGKNGKPNGRLSSGSDITDINKVILDLKYSEERLKVAFEANNIALFEHLVKENKHNTNQRGAELFGVSREYFEKSTNLMSAWHKNIHPEDREHVIQQYVDCLEGRSDRYHYDFRYKHKSLGYIWVRSYGKVVEFDENKNAVRIVGIDYDFTELKKKEIQLQESIVRYQTLVDTIPDHVMMLNKYGMILFHNTAFALDHGYEKTENLTGRNIIEFLHPDFHHLENVILKDVFKGFYKKEVKVLHKDNTEHFVEATAVPFKESPHSEEKILVVGRDVTKRKSYEDKLIEAKAKAEEADRMKSIFLSNMSHDVRTPLHAIMGFSDLLSEKGITPEQHEEFIQMIQKNGNNLLQLINDILDYSKIESGHISLVNGEISLNPFIYDLQLNYQQLAKQLDKEHIKIIMQIPEDRNEVIINTDGSRLKQIFDNLMNNSLKYSDSGDIQFGYSLLEDGTPEFFIEDNGVGIPVDMQPLIFERFKQSDVTHSRHFKGVGLGLAIVKSLIERMRGDIGLISKEGEGTRFTFRISLD